MIALYVPHDGPRTQLFGNIQPDGLPHAGDDFGFTGPNGETYPNVYAAADGVVLFAGDSRTLGWPNPYYLNPDFDRTDAVNSSAGNVVVIGHGSAGMTTYNHLESWGVVKGQAVRAGQVIAVTGSTGRSTGKHLHFEWIPYPRDYSTATYGRVRPTLKKRALFMFLSEKEEREALGILRTLRDRTADVSTGDPKRPVMVGFRQFLVNGVRAAEAARDQTADIQTGPPAKPVKVSLRTFLAQGTRAAQAAQENTEALLEAAVQK